MILSPFLKGKVCCDWDLLDYFLSVLWTVQFVSESLLLEEDVGPDRLSPLPQLQHFPVSFTVTEESAVLVRVYFLAQELKQVLIIFKMLRELEHKLSQTVKILNDDG
jgi:hypothetical protein